MKGFTLIETVISLSILTTILVGLSGAVLIGSKAIPSATEAGINDQRVIDAINIFRSEISHGDEIAESNTGGNQQYRIKSRVSAQAGRSDHVDYEYDSSAKTFIRKPKGEDEIVLIENISSMNFTIISDDKEALALVIILVVPDTVQYIYEAHMLIPSRIEIK